jgi:Domain of Unknown Function (DUF928)
MIIVDKISIEVLCLALMLTQIPVFPVNAQRVFEASNRSSQTIRDRRERTHRRTISGSRGCERSSAQMTLLIPENRVLLTASKHPTFLFFLSEVPARPIRVSVVDPLNPETIFDRTLTIQKAGIVAVIIPQTARSLENGKTYILTAGILCNPERMSASAYLRVSFEKIALNQEQQKKLERTSTPLERARFYNREGIWYDAIASSYEAAQTGVPEAVSYFQSLNAQINLQISHLKL